MPRAGLTRASVVAEAARLADEDGYDALTLAALAARLNVAVPSLYKHVGGLGALRREIAILAIEELGAALEAAARPDGGDGRVVLEPDHASRGTVTLAAPPPDPRLRALAHAYRSFARAHPGRYAATLRAAPAGDREYAAASDRVLGVVLAFFRERGLTGEEALDATRALRAGLHGFVALEAAGGFGLPQDVERSFGRLVDTLGRGLAAVG